MADRTRYNRLWMALVAASLCGTLTAAYAAWAQQQPTRPLLHPKHVAQKQMDEINADAVPEETAGNNPPAAPPAVTEAPSKKVSSLFYSQEEVRDIHLAINAYLKHVSNRQDLTFDEEAFLRRLSGIKTSSPSRYYTYPQFFLDSLVYHKADDWLIWLNGQKITQDTLAEGTQIHVLEIDAEKVKLEWMPPIMERVLEVWNKIPNDDIVVDQLRGKVMFTLRPNQTFSSYVMNVLEGKVVPVTVDTALIESAPSPSGGARKDRDAAVENVFPAPAPAQENLRNRKGLPGLIDSYRDLEQESIP